MNSARVGKQDGQTTTTMQTSEVRSSAGASQRTAVCWGGKGSVSHEPSFIPPRVPDRSKARPAGLWKPGPGAVGLAGAGRPRRVAPPGCSASCSRAHPVDQGQDHERDPESGEDVRAVRVLWAEGPERRGDLVPGVVGSCRSRLTSSPPARRLGVRLPVRMRRGGPARPRLPRPTAGRLSPGHARTRAEVLLELRHV